MGPAIQMLRGYAAGDDANAQFASARVVACGGVITSVWLVRGVIFINVLLAKSVTFTNGPFSPAHPYDVASPPFPVPAAPAFSAPHPSPAAFRPPSSNSPSPNSCPSSVSPND